jgi:hypothetical protein
LLMALGLALQPKLTPLNVQFAEVKCAKLTCNELAVGDAQVARRLDARHLDAAQLKTGVATLGILKADAANIDIVNSKLQNSQHVRVTDLAGMLHAEVRSTKSGGQVDIVRYTHGGPQRKSDMEARMFASNVDGDPIPLGVARLHWVKVETPESKPMPTEDKTPMSPAATEPPEPTTP